MGTVLFVSSVPNKTIGTVPAVSQALTQPEMEEATGVDFNWKLILSLLRLQP